MDQYEELCLRFRILTFLCKRKSVARSEIISKYNPDIIWLKDNIKQWKKLSYISINKHQAIVATTALEDYLRKFLQLEVVNKDILDVRKNKKNQEITYATPKIIALIEDLKDIIRS